MSAKGLVEMVLIGLFFVLYLLPIPMMGLVLKRNGGFRNGKLVVYTVISTLPLLVSGGFLFFGPDDLRGRLDLGGFRIAMASYLAVNFLFCVVFLFTALSDLTFNNRLMLLLSSLAASVMALLAFLASVFVTV